MKHPYLPDGDYLVLSDMQIPYHDTRTVQAVVQFARDGDFDGILCVGDEADSPEPSRWNKGMAGEYAGTFEAGLTETYDVLQEFTHSLGPDKPFHMMRSNHADRIQRYIAKYAPALNTSWNQYEAILGYGQAPGLAGRTEPLPVTYHRKPYAFARGWVLMHGDEGSLIQTAGGTALNIAKRVGASVVCGHTHRAGIQHYNQGHSGKITTSLIGVEVGHLMDLKKADYLKSGGANWQQAFAILRIRKGVVHPQLVLLKGGRFLAGPEQ